MKSFLLEIIIPDKSVFREEVESLVLPGTEGQVGILSGHEPAVIQLSPGIVKIRGVAESYEYIITGGYAEVSRGGVGIFAESAELPGEIDVGVSQENVRKARLILDNKDSSSEELITARITLEKESHRIKFLAKVSSPAI